MQDLQELNIIMVAPRGVGKTSLLAAMHEEFDNTFSSAGLTTWTTDGRTLDAIEECKRQLRNMDYRLQRMVDPTPPKLDPWDDEGFVFEVGSGSRKFMRIRFTDPSGEYFKSAASSTQKEYIREQLNECDAMIIPIDATALMEKKTGRTSTTELGLWHEEKNDPARITKLLKEAYAGLNRPRLVILAPLRCEAYMKTDKDANELLEHVKMGYRELLDFFRQDEQYRNLAIVVAPVQTIGHIAFSHAESTIEGFTRFFYNKVPLDAPYAPKDGDQPLRYVLRFLLSVFNEGSKRELERAQEDLQKLKATASTQSDQLENAKRRLSEAERRVSDRNQLWKPFKWVADLFDDVHTPHQEAQASCSERASELDRTTSKKVAVQDKAEATASQIQAFNMAISKFAYDCKQERGFAILQGRAKWLNPTTMGE
jgi:Double-GTPase 2